MRLKDLQRKQKILKVGKENPHRQAKIIHIPEEENQSKGGEHILRIFIHEKFPQTEVQTA